LDHDSNPVRGFLGQGQNLRWCYGSACKFFWFEPGPIRHDQVAAKCESGDFHLQILVNGPDAVQERQLRFHFRDDKAISPKAIWLLRKVTGLRQIEIAELMVSANNFTKGYAEALVLGTSKDELVHPEEPKKKHGMTREEIAKMELEMETIERDLKAVESSYGENMLNLTVARGYIKRLLDNAKIVKFLAGNFREILSEFESTTASESV